MRLLILMLTLALAACETTTHSATVLGEFDITHAAASRAWLVIDQEIVVGEVVRFEDVDGPRFFFSVRNPLHQEFGLIDQKGRAYRFKPHQPEPTWIGTGAVVAGARQILDSSEATELREVELSELTQAR